MSFKKVYDLINIGSYDVSLINKASNENFMVIHEGLVINVNLLQYACLKKDIALVKMFNLDTFKDTKILKFVREYDLGKDIYDYLSTKFVESTDIDETVNLLKCDDDKYIDKDKLYNELREYCQNHVYHVYKLDDKIFLLKFEDLNKLVHPNDKTTYIRQSVFQKKPEMFKKLMDLGVDPFIISEKGEHILGITKDNPLNDEQLEQVLYYAFKNNRIDEIKKSKYNYIVNLINKLQDDKYFIV